MTEQVTTETLVERLRYKNRGWHPDQVEAADEIERLRAEVERLRGAFQTLLNEMSDPVGSLGLDYEVRQITNGMVDDARAALEAK